MTKAKTARQAARDREPLDGADEAALALFDAINQRRD